WLWNKRWRALVGLMLVAILIAAVSALLSVPASVAYIRQVPALALQVRRILESRGSSAAVLPAMGAAGFAVLIIVIGLLIRSWTRTTPWRYRMVALWASPLITAPYLGAYDLTLALLPISFL